MESDNKVPAVVKLTVLGYELNSKQNAYVNYLLPAVFGCLVYIVHFAVDLVLVYRHYLEEDHVWSSLTFFFMYLPVITCFVLTVSCWEMWPEYEGCGLSNWRWFTVKLLQHLFFPVWTMWRYAERIFWSIEGIRSGDDEGRREDALGQSTAPRTIEFYFFLQGFMHTIPQIVLQLHILIRNVTKMDKQTLDIQAASIFLNISLMASTTALYQRFKTQKVGGKNYPWFKPYKYEYDPSIDALDGVGTATPKRKVGIVYCTKETENRVRLEIERQEMSREEAESKASSDYYLSPRGIDEVDFSVNAVRLIRALPEDDLVGKVLSFLWWLCFLIARFLAITTFAYFFPKDVIWLLCSHFILCVAFLLYDVQAFVVRRTKAVFFIFVGLIYIFCIIEFKKQFKKAKFIYNGYFALVFLENFTMCVIWWSSKLETIYNDWWFRFVFSVILLCTFLSFTSMVFYNIVSKPKKVVVGKELI